MFGECKAVRVRPISRFGVPALDELPEDERAIVQLDAHTDLLAERRVA